MKRKFCVRILCVMLCSMILVMSFNNRRVQAAFVVDDLAVIAILFAIGGIALTATNLDEDTVSDLDRAFEECYNSSHMLPGPDYDPDDDDDEGEDYDNYEDLKLAIKGDKAVTFSALTTYAIRNAVKLTYKSYNFGEHLADETIQEYQFDAQNPLDSDMLQYLFPGNADLTEKTAAFGFSNFNSTNEKYCKKVYEIIQDETYILNQKRPEPDAQRNRYSPVLQNVENKSDSMVFVRSVDGVSLYMFDKKDVDFSQEFKSEKNKIFKFFQALDGSSNYVANSYDDVPNALQISCDNIVLNPKLNAYVYDSVNGQWIDLKNGQILWIHPDYADQFDNNPDLEQHPTYDPNNLDIMELLQQLQQQKADANANPDLSPAQKTDAINQAVLDFFNKVNPSIYPDPGTKPDPDPGIKPDPDPGTDPDPDKPDPDKPDPDTPSNPDMPKKPSWDTIVADLTEIFPFCMPFDFVKLINKLDAEPKAPHFEIPVKIEFAGVDDKIVVDLKDWDPVAKVSRTCMTLVFLVGLIFATRGIIKG